MTRYPGGLIRATPLTPTTTSASGIWTLKEAMQAEQQGIWPPLTAISFIGNTGSTTDASTYTFSTHAIGAAADDRRVVVLSYSRAAGTTADYTSVTIGGNAASQVSLSRSTATNISIVGIHQLLVPAGTTADIVLNYNTTMLRAAIAVYRLTGSDGTAAHAASNEQNGADCSTAINVPANGVIVAGALTAANTSTTWTGVTENLDTTVETNNNYTAGSVYSATEQTGVSIVANFASPVAESALAVVSFG